MTLYQFTEISICKPFSLVGGNAYTCIPCRNSPYEHEHIPGSHT